MRKIMTDIRSLKALQGFVWTQLTDVQQEINGLLYFDRQPKLPFAVLSDIFRKGWGRLMSDLTLQQLKALRFWQTPEITSLNRLPAHTPLHSFRSLADAATGVASASRRSLDGDWQFEWFLSPNEVPDDWLTSEATEDCIRVPGNWQLQGYDKPSTPT